MNSFFKIILFLFPLLNFSQHRWEKEPLTSAPGVNFTNDIYALNDKTMQNVFNGNFKKPTYDTNDKILFLFDKWESKAVLTTKDGNKYQIDNLNYYINRKELMTKLSKDSFYIFDNSNIVLVQFDNKNYKILNNELYELLFNQKELLLLKGVSIKHKDEFDPFTKELKNRIFFKEFEYYFVDNSKNIIKINKADLMSFFKDKDELVSKFIKTNKLSFKKEDDLKKMFSYYSSL